MFNKHAILALAAISTQALKLRQEIVGGDPSTWAPEQQLSVDVADYTIAGDDPSTWAPEQQLSVDVADYTIAGGDPSTWAPEQQLSVELAQVVRDVSQEYVECILSGPVWCDELWLSLAQVGVDAQAQVEIRNQVEEWSYSQDFVECVLSGPGWCDELWLSLVQTQVDAQQARMLAQYGPGQSGGRPNGGRPSRPSYGRGLAQADATYFGDSYVECVMQGGSYCDPDLLGLAQVEVESQADAEWSNDIDMLGCLKQGAWCDPEAWEYSDEEQAEIDAREAREAANPTEDIYDPDFDWTKCLHTYGFCDPAYQD